MGNDCTYYFAFRKDHKLYGYWIEVIGTYSQREAMDVFHTRYGNRSWGINPDALKFHPKGCYEKIHLPLPENIKIDLEDPFFGEPKKKDDLWEIFSDVSCKQQIERMRRLGQKNNIIIVDDAYGIMPSKKLDIHQEINFNAANAIIKTYTKDFRITFSNKK